LEEKVKQYSGVGPAIPLEHFLLFLER